MKQVRISDLKAHLSEHLRSVEEGETIEVMDRTRPVARIAAVERESSGLELIAPARPFAKVRSIRVRPLKLAQSSTEVLRQERGSR